MKPSKMVGGLLSSVLFVSCGIQGQQAEIQEAGSSGQQAQEVREADCEFSAESACLLGTSRSYRGIDVHYPNLAACGVRLVATRTAYQQELDKVAQGLVVTLDGSEGTLTPTVSVGNHANAIVYRFSTTHQAYVARLNLRTQSGESLKSLFQRALADTLGAGEPSFVALPVACEN